MKNFFLRIRSGAKDRLENSCLAVEGCADAIESLASEDPNPASVPAVVVPASSPSVQEQPPKRKSFGFMECEAGQINSGVPRLGAEPVSARPDTGKREELRERGRQDHAPKLKKPSLLPGSDGEHGLQEKYGTKDRACTFYDRQVLDYLAPAMREFIPLQEFLFVSTSDRHGECDCTSKFGEPGFIRVLSDKHLIYPEYRGNGVYANSGNLAENPHIAMLIVDFYRDAVGLHVNGKARVVENPELLACADKLPEDILEEINREGKRRPERWVMVEVEEAYIQCSKHIPLLKKLDRKIDWGTDSVAAKKGDYFQLQDIPLYNRVGGDKAIDVAVDVFYRKVLQDDLVDRFFEDVDMEGQRLKQKSFLAMAFGGPYQYSGLDLRKAHGRLVEQMGLTDEHFDRVATIFRETMEELEISSKEIGEMMAVLETARDDILNR